MTTCKWLDISTTLSIKLVYKSLPSLYEIYITNNSNNCVETHSQMAVGAVDTEEPFEVMRDYIEELAVVVAVVGVVVEVVAGIVAVAVMVVDIENFAVVIVGIEGLAVEPRN